MAGGATGKGKGMDADRVLLPLPTGRMAAILLLLLTAILSPNNSRSYADSLCVDQIQRCGMLVEDFERQLQDLRNLAFRKCFTNTACIHEKVAFDDCFSKAVRALRAPFGDSSILANDEFLVSAEEFRTKAEQCFSGETGTGTVPLGSNGNGSTDSGEDVAYLGRVVFGAELADRLWGLPAGDLGKEQVMDPGGGCGTKDSGGSRVFGAGISRIVDSSASQLSNLNTSCTLPANETGCFRRAMDQDPQYRLLVTSRDRALRSCIQNARLQSEANCQFSPVSLVRPCVCRAREDLDARMQSAILSCVRDSPVAQLYSALVALSSGSALPPLTNISPRYKPDTPAAVSHQTTGPPLPGTSLQIGEEPLSVPSGSVLTQGSVTNGQCLCACPERGQCVSSASLDAQGTARLRTADPTTAQSQAYRPMPAMPWYYQPIQTAMSAEAGIASGFERFFNGQPPLRRKKRDEGNNVKD